MAANLSHHPLVLLLERSSQAGTYCLSDTANTVLLLTPVLETSWKLSAELAQHVMSKAI